MQRESDGEKQQLSKTKSIYTVIVLIRSARLAMPSSGESRAAPGALACDGTDRDTCEGQTIKPDLDSQAIAHIDAARAALLLMSAWHGWKRPKVAITVSGKL